jgi:hypothetical protein
MRSLLSAILTILLLVPSVPLNFSHVYLINLFPNIFPFPWNISSNPTFILSTETFSLFPGKIETIICEHPWLLSKLGFNYCIYLSFFFSFCCRGAKPPFLKRLSSFCVLVPALTKFSLLVWYFSLLVLNTLEIFFKLNIYSMVS